MQQQGNSRPGCSTAKLTRLNEWKYECCLGLLHCYYCMAVHRLSIIFESKGSELVLEYAGFGAVSAAVY